MHRMQIWRTTRSSPGTSHESEASEASVFCFDNRELKQEDFSRRRRGEIREGPGLTSSLSSQI